MGNTWLIYYNCNLDNLGLIKLGLCLKTCHIIRYKTSDQGTLGLFVGHNFNLFTIELPWRDNKQNISCVPPGAYVCKIRQSPKFGKVFMLQDVVGRSYILTHSGNVAGDVAKGYKTHSAGCILVGKLVGKISGQDAVLSSRPAIREFMQSVGKENFKMIIHRGM